MKLREKQVENYLVRVAKRHGWTAEKFTSPGRRSVPDRICWKDGIVFFVECKAEGEEPTDAQDRDHKRRRKAGFKVYVVDCYEDVNNLPWHGTVHR